MMHLRLKPLLRCIFTFAVLFIHARGQPGFTSIDCGLPAESNHYNDTKTGIIYTSDHNLYIDRGVVSAIDPKFVDDSVDRHLRTVRYFPREDGGGNKSCYDLTSLQASNKTYLIRATFRYGNYDGRNQPPRFDLYLGVEFWETVELNDSISVVTKEIVHAPCSSYLYVCLADSGTGTPFISALELRLLNQDDTYRTGKPGESLAFFLRWNFAPADPDKIIRYPDDEYDRLWHPYASPGDWIPLNTASDVWIDNGYNPPEAAMQSAVAPRNPNNSLQLLWSPASDDRKADFFVYLHIAEVVKLSSGEYRGMYVDLNDFRWWDEAVVPEYRSLNTLSSGYGYSGARFNLSLEKAQNSTLPPIINAVEVYMVKQQLHSQTDENDVVAILKIKSQYGVKRDWQGDPCSPKVFTWDALNCNIYVDLSIPPRIISLNLSSYGLNGTVSSYFSKLTFLKSLDLSNNNLSGSVPEFLAELSHLKVLNLSGNMFSGSIPHKLLDRANSDGLQLRVDGNEIGTPEKCEAGKCKSSNKSNQLIILIVVPLTASILVVLAASFLIWRFRRKKTKDARLGSISNRRSGFLEAKNKKFTYSDILRMTNNFQRVIGRGGFGRVYYGTTADGKQVAVKLLSRSSAQGYNEFQTEAELLTRVHHCKLTILVGYCYDGTHMALVYEYMALGNLREHLSGDDDNVLSWSERLRILLDAAQGLDYLHYGCKPPIIHRDIKSTNILLNENLEAKLADFGLSRAFTLDDGSFASTRVVGTPGYLDPEYYETQMLHEKSDIYSFGVVMLEVITSRAVISLPHQHRRHIVHWVSCLLETGDLASIVDPNLRGVYDVNTVWRALEIAMACAAPTSVERPNTAHVLAELKDCLEAERAHSEGHETDDASYLLEVDPGILEIEIGAR